jgi:hypothetical protein
MTNRRQFLTTIPVAAALGFVTTPGSSAERAVKEIEAAKAAQGNLKFCEPGPNDAPALCNPIPSHGVIDTARNDAFPRIEMTNQDGVTEPFYEGFVKDRIVVMNFMSIREERDFQATGWLARVVGELGDKVGRDVHVYSVSRDPEYDTPARLKAFAASFDAPEGWQFLTSSKKQSSDLAFRMYRMGHSSMTAKRKVDVVFYGNGGVGLWGAFPIGIQPEDAAGRVAWVMPQQVTEGKHHRAGPRIFEMNDRRNHNREV